MSSIRRPKRRRAAAWLLRLVVVGALALVAFLPPLTTLETPEPDTARIVSYKADMDLRRDGTLETTETIVVDMPSGKRGIFRIFDTADPRRRGVEHPVSDVYVERDGSPEPAEWNASAVGTETLRIGNPNVYLSPGQHTYVIRSTTVDAIEPDPDGDDLALWWWDVVGGGWQMAMGSAEINVNLPAAPARPPECVMGEDTPCEAQVVDNRLTVTTGPLEPMTPVTVRVAFPADAVDEPPAGDALGPTVLWSIVAAAAAAAVGLVLLRLTKEEPPGFPVLFEPPPGIGPALGAKVLDEVHSEDDLQATLMNMGEKGVLRLDGDGDSWNVSVVGDPGAAGLDRVELAVLSALGLSTIGSSFHVTKSSVGAGQKVQAARRTLRSMVDSDARQYLAHSGGGMAARAFGSLGVIGVLGMVAVYEFSDTGWRNWPLLAASAALALVLLGAVMDPGASTKRTPAGRDLWSRVGGFARFLTTDSAESRFDAASHLDWYPRYLPWAVALGSADAWAKRFEAQGIDITDTSVVPYLGWYGAGRFSTSSMASSFTSTIAAASAAYTASQSSSSSGGGGFSGGSGGGGGGGGSW